MQGWRVTRSETYTMIERQCWEMINSMIQNIWMLVTQQEQQGFQGWDLVSSEFEDGMEVLGISGVVWM